MREDEEHCRVALDRLLREEGPSPQWQDGDEPPDYYVLLKDRRFAVEITSIHGNVSIAGKKRPAIGVENDLLEFGDEVCVEVGREVEVPGVFTVTFPGLPGIGSRKREIVDALTNFFGNRRITASEVIQIPNARLGVAEIEVSMLRGKEQSRESGLAPIAAAYGLSPRSPDDQLAPLLTGAIEKKATRMQKVEKPWILVILDRYGLQRSIENWMARLPAAATRFQAIIRVSDGAAEILAGSFESRTNQGPSWAGAGQTTRRHR